MDDDGPNENAPPATDPADSNGQLSPIGDNTEGARTLPRGRGTPLPSSVRVSPQLTALCQRAATGASDDIKRLGKWSALVEHEAQMLRRRLRKQQHDFATLFEIVGETSARALDVVSMQTYLLRTVSGHFTTPKLLIVRRMRAEDRTLYCSAAQGVREPKVTLPLDSQLCQFALERRFCFSLKELPGDFATAPEVQALKALSVDMAVPLIQEVEGPGAVLEGFLFLGHRLSGMDYNQEDVEFLHILGKMLAICLRNEALYRSSIIDDLTGVASRGHFDAQLSQELNRIQTYGHKSLGLAMLDVDHFKQFNDTYGHQTGDKVLQELARVLIHQVRNVDLVARYGGEEFAIILLEIDRPRVLDVANRLRKAVEDMVVLAPDGKKLNVTASFGLACFPDDADDKFTLIQLADEALYRSKDAGRNRVTVAEPGSGLRAKVKAPAEVAKTPDAARAAPAQGPRPTRSLIPSALMNGIQAELELIQRKQRQIALESGMDDEQIVERRRNARKAPEVI